VVSVYGAQVFADRSWMDRGLTLPTAQDLVARAVVEEFHSSRSATRRSPRRAGDKSAPVGGRDAARAKR
jgi:hypothetical protein